MKSLALLCLLLLPGAAYAKSDAPALALLDKTAAKVHSLHSLSADYAGTEEYPAHPQSVPDRGTLLLARPNLSCITYRAADPSRRPNGPAYLPYARQWASDGHTYWTVGYIREYAKHPASPSGKELTVLDPVPDFFDPRASYAAQVCRLQARNMLLSLSVIGHVRWRGMLCTVVQWRSYDDSAYSPARNGPVGHAIVDNQRFFIGSDGLPCRLLSCDSNGLKADNMLSHLHVNPALPRAAFAFHLPPGAKPRTPVLADGASAPDFTVQNAAGRPIHLSDYRGKVVVLDFWATWCPPCQASFPHTADVLRRHVPQGLTVLAVNVRDNRPAFMRWLARKQSALRPIAFAIDPTPDEDKNVAASLYGVRGLPTQFVIGRDGRIVQSFVGYDGPTDDLDRAVRRALSGPQ